MVFGDRIPLVNFLHGIGNKKKGVPKKGSPKKFGGSKGPTVDESGTEDADPPNYLQQLAQDLNDGEAVVTQLAMRANHVKGELSKACAQLLESVAGKDSTAAKSNKRLNDDDDDMDADDDDEDEGGSAFARR